MRISDWSSDVCSSDLPFAIIDLRADHDRQELAARMFIGVAKRQEGQENLFVAAAEVVDENFGGARGIVQDRALMLHHAARRADGDAGIDQARQGASRGGKGWGCACRCRWSPHNKNK